MGGMVLPISFMIGIFNNMSNVVVIRFLGGEELIGELVSTDVTGLILKNVAVIQMLPSKSGGIGISLFPFAPYASKPEFQFHPAFIMTMFEPATDMLNSYNQQYGAGIVVAGPQQLAETTGNVIPFPKK